MATSRPVVRAWHRHSAYVLLIAAIVLSSLFPDPVLAEDKPAASKLEYRGFTVDVTVLQNNANAAAVEASVKHQIDIVADSGVKPDILKFFREQEIILKAGVASHGRFDAKAKGVSIEDTVEPPQRPIVLHELLHAYHYYVLPQGPKNPDILKFYGRAKSAKLYPANEYLMKNPFEFFAVTGSLYLWGNVDREPHTRDKLKAAQPIYYAWLGRLFGVQK